jgi:hypothetical protein
MFPLQVGNHPFHLDPMRCLATGTAIGQYGQMMICGKLLDPTFLEIGHGAKNLKLPGKDLLFGNHRADLAAEEHVQQEGLDDIVSMMPQGYLPAALFLGDLK